MDVGSTNLSEGGQFLGNQCFYLALARSWLANAAGPSSGLLIRDSALQLKRDIESCVVEVRGDAACKDVGEEVEAYADSLVCALGGEGKKQGSVVADLAVAVFASGSGTIEAYEGRGYAQQQRNLRVANLALVWHRVGHFEAVVGLSGGKVDLELDELLARAEDAGIPTTVVRA
eukprot:gnl/TRDRNA2_/TRDRNA2_83674_c0_seq1.p1 gnl/TRDRNA2_/TRDRNA2_83674_c0~~gnl/TRDRNA2_/TRDRNA2_83674_c0_seq1.p1  ORF type:complete len:174 (+),score=32.41 gnl/TRDRNA2_/TRDRNA2_83674_c0_seq1:66-587(+)